ncbi:MULTISPECIES: hypothetical protein [unclassified Psychrobacter]|uniref:hypothetical protein n=1 Tax=unclassified Psychrobacter TaxID=196806 RepID=UPI0025DBCF04|nr:MULTISPECIES: hypothetical protein [unclassified Psychrobacter]
MTAIIEQINTEQLAAKLKELQAEFKHGDLMEYLRAKPLNIDLDVNKDDIVISFDLNQDNAITVEIKTDYNRGELVNVEISYIEVDNIEDTYFIDDEDSDLLLQCKRIIHDAVHYKLLDEDSEIKTNFYDDVYA